MAKKEEAREGEATGSVKRAGKKIGVRDPKGKDTMFKVKKQTFFGTIMNLYATRRGVHVSDLRFVLDRHPNNPEVTCASLELEDGDQVDVDMAQSVC